MKRVILCIAAAASIATTTVSGWDVPTHHDIAPITLDETRSTVRYVIHAELRGQGPFEGLDGWMKINIYQYPSSQSPVQVELRGLTHPTLQDDSGVAIPQGATSGEGLAVDAWLECTSDPCAEDFELVITRTTAAPVDISGTVFVNANGTADTAPLNTEVVMTVMGPL